MKLVKWIPSFLPGGSLRRLADEGREALRTMLDAPYNTVKEMRVRIDFSLFIYLFIHTLYESVCMCLPAALRNFSTGGIFVGRWDCRTYMLGEYERKGTNDEVVFESIRDVCIYRGNSEHVQYLPTLSLSLSPFISWSYYGQYY